MKNNKGIAPIIIILIVAGILALGGGGYYAVKKYKAPAIQPVVTQNQPSAKVIKNILTQEGNSLIGVVTVLVSAGTNDLNIFELPFYPQFSKVEGNFQGTIGDISHSRQIVGSDFVKNSDNTTKILSGKEITINYTVKYLPKNNIDNGTYYVNLNDGHDCMNYKPENYVPVQGEEGNIYPCLKVVGQTESNRLTVQAQTSDWKTYTNTQSGYTISYPADAKIDNTNSTCFRIDTKEFGSVTIGINADACGMVGGIGIGTTKTNETIVINGQEYTASGVRTGDNSTSLAGFSITNKIYVRYGVDHFDKTNPKNWKYLGSLTDPEYQIALNSAKQILYTFKLAK